MSDAYITLWSRPQIEIQRRLTRGEQEMTHTANAQFRRAGVTPGDRVYVVGTKDGELLLLGRLGVGRVVSQREAEAQFGHDVYEAPDHLLGAGTRIDLDRVVPESIARQIERESGKPIKMDPARYQLNVHSLRTTGRITEDSAALFDSLLDR